MDSSTVGPFTTEVVEVSNSSIVATATINGITLDIAKSAGIECKDGSGIASTWYLDSGKGRKVMY